MSLNINTNRVESVLLADGWHDVADASFEIDGYEFVQGDDEQTVLAGGKSSHVPSKGFFFIEHGVPVVGPITSILAVRMEV